MKEGTNRYRLLDVCDVYQPKTISTKELVPNGKYFVFGANGIIGKYNEYNHPNSEVLLTCRGNTCGAVNLSYPCSWINGNAMVVHPKDNCISQQYLFHLLKSLDYRHIITGAAQPQITRISLKDVEIPIPPLSEQQQIVDFLDAEFAKIDELKKQAEQSLQNAKEFFQSALKEMLTPKEGWKEVKLSQIGSINRGVSKHRPRNAPELMGDYLPLVQTGDVANSDKYIETYSSSYSKLGVEQSRVWEPGALCITIAANIGKASILNFKACFPDSVVGFIANPGTNIDFIYYQFCILQSILEANAPGAAQKNINLRILSELKLFVPEYKEQVRIAEKLDRLRETKNSLQSNYTRTIQLCADLKQALLRQVFE